MGISGYHRWSVHLHQRATRHPGGVHQDQRDVQRGDGLNQSLSTTSKTLRQQQGDVLRSCAKRWLDLVLEVRRSRQSLPRFVGLRNEPPLRNDTPSANAGLVPMNFTNVKRPSASIALDDYASLTTVAAPIVTVAAWADVRLCRRRRNLSEVRGATLIQLFYNIERARQPPTIRSR